jgi:hypothetical protein
VVELLAPIDVGEPLLGVLGVLAAVVLNNQSARSITKIESAQPLSVAGSEDEIDRWFRQSSQHQQKSQPGLHGRVDTVSHQRSRSAGQLAAAAGDLSHRGDQTLGARGLRLDQAVAHDHQVDQCHPDRREIEEGLFRRGDRQPPQCGGLDELGSVVGLDPLTNRAAGRCTLSDVDGGRRGRCRTPELGGRVVAHAGSDRRNIESRPGPEAEVDGHACAHVLVVDHFLELTAEQRSQGHAGGSRIGSAVEPGLVDPGHGSILRPQVPGSAVPSGTSVDKWAPDRIRT